MSTGDIFFGNMDILHRGERYFLDSKKNINTPQYAIHYYLVPTILYNLLPNINKQILDPKGFFYYDEEIIIENKHYYKYKTPFACDEFKIHTLYTRLNHLKISSITFEENQILCYIISKHNTCNFPFNGMYPREIESCMNQSREESFEVNGKLIPKERFYSDHFFFMGKHVCDSRVKFYKNKIHNITQDDKNHFIFDTKKNIQLQINHTCTLYMTPIVCIKNIILRDGKYIHCRYTENVLNIIKCQIPKSRKRSCPS